VFALPSLFILPVTLSFEELLRLDVVLGVFLRVGGANED